MQIRTFRAATLQDALEEIRQQMGPDASVLHTKHVSDGWMGWLGQSFVEVTACAGLGNSSHTTNDDPHKSRSLKADSRNLSSTNDSENTVGSENPNERLQALPLAMHRNAMVDQSGLPAQLQALQEQLRRAGVPDSTAQRWVQSTNSFAVGLGDLPYQPWREHLHRSVARELAFGGPIRIPPGSRHVVALVGPTGVGKTTTIAKLAAGFRIEAKRKVGLLTIDTFRIAAVQQLKSYAQIMDLPMQVVERPDQMRPALETLGDVDLVLIDTAGRSPRSDARIDQLVDLLRSAQPDETHLVLSASHSITAINTVLRGFARAQPTATILTKLDETPNTASVLAAVTAADTFASAPLSYVTNGQQVPDDIAVANAELLLEHLLPKTVAFPGLEAA